MKNAIRYFAPILESTQSSFSIELYKESIELYDNGKPVEALHTLIDSLNPEFRQKYGNSEGTEFHIPHGSISVDIKLNGNSLSVHSDFMRLPEKGSVAMLRQVTGLNTGNLLLPSFRLKGDTLSLDYECTLDQSHPAKMYGVFSDICYIGDQYDDEFATKFGATRISEPKTSPYPTEETDRMYDTVQTICNDALAAVKEYNDDRLHAFSWNIIETAFYQIMYATAPQGQLLNDMDKAIADMDKDLPVTEIVAKGTEVLKRLQATPKESLAGDFYFVGTFISTKRRSSLKNIQDNFKEVFEKAEQAMQAGNHEAAAVRMLFKFYEMYYYNNVQDDIHRKVSKALAEASGQEWEQAAEILYDAMDDIMEGNIEDDPFGLDFSAAVQNAAQELAAAQPQVSDMQAIMAEMQQKMAESLAKGDMQEYMRLAAEMQQKVMQQAMNAK